MTRIETKQLPALEERTTLEGAVKEISEHPAQSEGTLGTRMSRFRTFISLKPIFNVNEYM